MTNREVIARSLCRLDCEDPDDLVFERDGRTPRKWETKQGEADTILADLQDAGLVIMPAVATNRMRHEACKGAVGITAGTFALMWQHIVAYARTLDR